MINVPRRFWITLAGFIGVAVCSLLNWVQISSVSYDWVLGVRQEQIERTGYNLFTLLNVPESGSLRSFMLVLAVLLVSAIAAIAVLAVLALRRPDGSKMQTALTYWGFGLAALIPLVFAVFAASISDPMLNNPAAREPVTLGLTLFLALQAIIAVAVMVTVTEKLSRAVRRDWQIYVLLFPAFALVFIFSYLPMYGIQIVFRDFKPGFGIAASEWIGWKNFTDFFAYPYASRLIMNTLLLNVYGLFWTFPVPIIMAIFLNQITMRRFKRFTQTAIYAPHFISPVVMIGMLMLFLSPSSGLVNMLIEWLGGNPVNFMLEASWFRGLFIGTEVWQHAGWNTILYIAALTAIDLGLYEAATIDGATKWQKIRYIDIPHLVPIIVMLIILNCGAMLVSNTDKALLMWTPGNSPRAEIIGVFVYNIGLVGGQFSFVAAINLFINVINFVMIVTVNQIAKRMKQASLF